MSTKTTLINVITDYQNKYAALARKVEEIKTSEMYTPEAKERDINDTIRAFEPTVKEYHDRILEIINGGMDALNKKSVGFLLDRSYQETLNNIIHMIDSGVLNNADDIKMIISQYAGDANASAALKEALLGCKNKDAYNLVTLIPMDNRDKHKELMEKFKKNVDDTIDFYAVQCDLSYPSGNLSSTNVAMNLTGMLDFVGNRLGDNLELLN